MPARLRTASASPTKVQNFLLASSNGKKGEVDSVDDADLIRLDHYALDPRAEDFATRAPVGLFEAFVDRVRKAVETCESFPQCGLLGPVMKRPPLAISSRQPRLLPFFYFLISFCFPSRSMAALNGLLLCLLRLSERMTVRRWVVTLVGT